MRLKGAGRRGGALSLATAIALGGCASPAPNAQVSEAAAGYAGFPSCAEETTISADPALYRDRPQYGNAWELTDRVRTWASAKPGFEELWLDEDNNRWVTVGFHGVDGDALAGLQEELAEAFPGEGIVAVGVPHGNAQLEGLRDRVVSALNAADAAPSSYGHSVPHNRVSVGGLLASADAEAALRQFAGEPLCVDVLDPADFPPEGEQPTVGEGWRLLGHAQGVGAVYRTAVATTDGQLAALWRESGLDGDSPTVNWHTEIVVWFGAVYGGGCPLRLDGVAVDGTTLHGEFVTPGVVIACDGDANPHSFVAAVERALLPDGPFAVQLNAADPPPGATEERALVDVDLSTPGATATNDQLRPDPDAGPHPAPAIEDGHAELPEQGARYVWHPRPDCPDVVIGPIAGTQWRLADGEPDWAVSGGQELALFPLDDQGIMVLTSGADYYFIPADDGRCAP